MMKILMATNLKSTIVKSQIKVLVHLTPLKKESKKEMNRTLLTRKSRELEKKLKRKKNKKQKKNDPITSEIMAANHLLETDFSPASTIPTEIG